MKVATELHLENDMEPPLHHPLISDFDTDFLRILNFAQVDNILIEV